VLAYGLLFVEYVARIVIDLLRTYFQERKEEQDNCCAELFKLVETANDGYFGTPTHKMRSRASAS
jgi:hypothetical protein